MSIKIIRAFSILNKGENIEIELELQSCLLDPDEYNQGHRQ